MKKLTLLLSLALSQLAGAADIDVDLGSRDRVARLFSVPNCLSNCPQPAPSLEQTVALWLTTSVRADAEAKTEPSVKVWQRGDRIIASLHDVQSDYGDVVRDYLEIGDLAYTNAEEVKRQGKWQSDWRFFLTLGMAMRNHQTVQLLHFPPDTVLNDTQNYLTAATTKRWATLLNLNGADPRSNALYQTIADIAPIAAPADAGAGLDGVYDTFAPYSKALLQSWTAPKAGSSTVRPVVALGGPVRSWLGKQYNLGTFKVLDLAYIDFGRSKQVPVLGGNHPSAIWYASTDRTGISMMRQDLTVACWQNSMARQPAGDAKVALESCKQGWQDTNAVCRLYYTTVKGKSAAEAGTLCKNP